MLICTLVPYHTGYRLKRIRLDQPNAAQESKIRFASSRHGLSFIS
jgi:hypothetical protein